ncbi:MAG: hypothetical protein QXT39_00245 [Conexivisphaerales archaeon]
MGDLKEFFEKNYEIIRPNHTMIFVDNVRDVPSDIWKKETVMRMAPFAEVITGDWFDPSLCLMDILLKLKETSFSRAMVIDSDDVLPPNFQLIDDLMKDENFGYYTLAEQNAEVKKAMYKRRSKLIKKFGDIEVYNYKITGLRKGVFFIGPKQAIVMSKEFVSSLDSDVINQVSVSMRNVPSQLRHAVSDETTLGVVLYFSGIRYTPWIIASHHAFASGLDYHPLFVSSGQSLFARQLFKRIRHRRVLWYYLRYKFALVMRSILV